MIVRAEKPNTHYTVVRNSVLRDSRLSYRARGILGCILSRPDNWETSAEALAAEGNEGRDAIRAALTELESAGYLRRTKVNDPTTGRIRTVSTIYDEPAGQAEDGKPGHGEPVVGLPVDGFPGPLRSNEKEVMKEVPKGTSVRKPDLLFEAMASVFGQPETTSERGRINKALKELRKAGATPEEIVTRSQEARRRWGHKFAPQTLVSRWGDLSNVESEAMKPLKGNAQFGKDYLPFKWETEEELLEGLGCEVFNGN